MYPEPAKQSIFTPKILIICGVIVIVLTVGINYAYNSYVERQVTTQDPASDEEPSGESIEIQQDTFTYESEDQRYSIDYPKNITVKELPNKYYGNTQRLFEGQTELVVNKKKTEAGYFRMVITAQRSYKDDEDKAELLSNLLTSQRFCPTGEYKKIKEFTQEINDKQFTIRKNVRNCGAPYTTFYDSFTRVGTYVIQIQSTQPFEQVKPAIDELINTLYLDKG